MLPQLLNGAAIVRDALASGLGFNAENALAVLETVHAVQQVKMKERGQRFADAMNWRHLLWANDFPHSDSTWPWSQDLLAEHAADLSDEQRRAILSGNVAELSRIDPSTLAA